MLMKSFTVLGGALLLALPLAAQERGSIEFGAFGSAASFDNSLSLKTGYGGGGRLGAYLTPRWSIEFEDAEMKATRPNGLKNVNVGLLTGRLVGNTPGNFSLIAGAGAGLSTETNFLHSYGLGGLAGFKVKMGPNAAFRVDATMDWLANNNWKSYRSVRAGISLYRHPTRSTRTVMMAGVPPMAMEHSDSVSAAETRRLRDRDAAYSALRDSLANARVPAATRAVMEAQLHFAFDKSDLTDSAKVLLDDKIALFRANPEMSVVMVGYTDVTGTDAYNMALGTRRAQAAKDYIVEHGIDASRVIIESRGERQQITNSAGVEGEAPNRRAVFRLLIAPDKK